MSDFLGIILSSLYKSFFNKRQLKILEFLKKREILNYAENRHYQSLKLSAIILLAKRNIDFYRNLDIDFLETLSYDSFQKIPLMTKELIRTKSDSLVNNNFNKMEEVFQATSGGSTGEPVRFFQTKSQAHHGIGNYWYALFLNGVNINEKSISLWGAQRDMHAQKQSFDLKSYLNNVTVLNTFVLSDDIINNYIKRMNAIKPEFIKAYVHSIYEIAKYINAHQIKIEFEPIIHCTTGPLYPEMKAEISRAFNNAWVYNYYGSREVHAIATSVSNEDGLYILYDNVFVEILDENDQPVRKGVEGNIVITTLNNNYMPLIRYKIGDRGVKGDDLTFGTLKLENVTGRTLGVLCKKDGTRVDGQYFTTLFFNKKGIKNFQLVQKSLDEIVVRIVKSEYFNDAELTDVLNAIVSEMGEVVLTLEFKDQIDLTATGKTMYVYSELDI